jgi:hypothetical protein
MHVRDGLEHHRMMMAASVSGIRGKCNRRERIGTSGSQVLNWKYQVDSTTYVFPERSFSRMSHSEAHRCVSVRFIWEPQSGPHLLSLLKQAFRAGAFKPTQTSPTRVDFGCLPSMSRFPQGLHTDCEACTRFGQTYSSIGKVSLHQLLGHEDR